LLELVCSCWTPLKPNKPSQATLLNYTENGNQPTERNMLPQLKTTTDLPSSTKTITPSKPSNKKTTPTLLQWTNSWTSPVKNSPPHSSDIKDQPPTKQPPQLKESMPPTLIGDQNWTPSRTKVHAVHVGHSQQSEQLKDTHQSNKENSKDYPNNNWLTVQLHTETPDVTEDGWIQLSNSSLITDLPPKLLIHIPPEIKLVPKLPENSNSDHSQMSQLEIVLHSPPLLKLHQSLLQSMPLNSNSIHPVSWANVTPT